MLMYSNEERTEAKCSSYKRNVEARAARQKKQQNEANLEDWGLTPSPDDDIISEEQFTKERSRNNTPQSHIEKPEEHNRNTILNPQSRRLRHKIKEENAIKKPVDIIHRDAATDLMDKLPIDWNHIKDEVKIRTQEVIMNALREAHRQGVVSGLRGW
jgi:hypothetical protein